MRANYRVPHSAPEAETASVSDENVVPDSPVATSLGRRAFFGRAAATAAGIIAFSGMQEQQARADLGPLTPQERREASRKIRITAAQNSYDAEIPPHPDNGDEVRYPNKIGNFSKSLPHNALGEVDITAYGTLIKALSSGKPADFENITIGLGHVLTDPQAGLAFDMEGADGHSLAIPPAPALASAETAGEAVELYWMALLRDVPFIHYDSSTDVVAAAAELSRLSDFRGPRGGNGQVTPDTIFRGFTPGALKGPLVSQFLAQDIPYGALYVPQRMQSVISGKDYMTDYGEWLYIQNGGLDYANDAIDPTPRYMRCVRDMGQWVHHDGLYQHYLDAAFILMSMNAPVDPGNPYAASRTQMGFGTFGPPHLQSLIGEVATRALKTVWYEKWYVHRRLRPEAYGGLVHNQRSGNAQYPLAAQVLNSQAVANTYSRYGSYLMPMSFPEGCPSHPAYGAGHATVAGACTTVLKAWFDESFIIPNPVQSDAAGTSMMSVDAELTVGDELNKLAANVALARSMAGVHWRSDYTQSVMLGEQVAVRLLREAKAVFNERFTFTLTGFDGTPITI